MALPSALHGREGEGLLASLRPATVVVVAVLVVVLVNVTKTRKSV